jgi:signal transduction histidine kinase
MAELQTSNRPKRLLAAITPLEWAGVGACLLLGLALASVLRGAVIEPVSWLVWTTIVCHLSVLCIWAWRGAGAPAGLYAALCAVPATLMAAVPGGLAGAGMAAVLWPLLFFVAAGLPMRIGLGASVAATVAGILTGAITGPLASNDHELPSLVATGWAGGIGLGLAGLYLAAGLAGPFHARAGRTADKQHLARALADACSAREEAALARDEATSKARFMAEMSHEIRNPLTAILGFSETMREGVLGPMPGPYQDYPRLIHDSGRHLLDLVSDLLDLSKIEAGRYTVGRDVVRLDTLASQSVEMMAGAANRAKVRLRLRASGPVEALGDAKALRQSLLNLISNALKFTPEGGQIQVGATRSADGRATVLEVRDTGIGMSEEALVRATEVYASSADQGSARGTGLGLALVQQLTRLQGGHLSLASAPGQGTVARILLPMAENSEPVRD